MSGTVDIQQIYSLTPMQEGMLFHRLHDEDQAYFLQMNLTLRGELDLHLFRQSVN
ncbi:condensation domain-containing protein, partial [Paenibacillus sp. JCM 10914]|uniref:condensation domain-containing protein n=1 Tax=Paenibacillus sp. JCM 10914 TaxID=1236974 RepID=UPI000B2CAFE1